VLESQIGFWRNMIKIGLVLILVGLTALSVPAAVLTYGDVDLLGFGYPGGSDPTAGATLEGLTPDSVTLATNSFGHAFPFSPGVGDFAGTDQIFVGSTQTGSHDGYSVAAERINGPQVFLLDYSSLIVGGSLSSLTLGIGADDFQQPTFGQPFTARVNGVINTALTNQLNAIDQTGPVTRFLTIGLDPLIDTPSHVLTLSIDGGGDGGDGWAVDFLTVGAVTTDASAVPEPAGTALVGLGLTAFSVLGMRRTLAKR